MYIEMAFSYGIDKSNEKEYNHFQIFFSITAASGVAYLLFAVGYAWLVRAI